MKYLLFTFILSFSLASRSAQIEEFDKNFYVLKGLIETGDSDKLLVKIKNTKHFGLLLDSKGGDLEEAIKLGSIVKTLGMTVRVSKDGVCGSACFFIYMNGLSRLAAGIEFKIHSKSPIVGFIAIHRPFFKVADTNNQKVLEKKAAEYLKNLSVPTDLIEKMMSVSSVDAYFLTNDDIDRLRTRPSEIEELYISKCNFDPKDNENINTCTIEISSDIFVSGYTKIMNGWKPRGYLDSSWRKLAKFDNGTIFVDYNSIIKNGKLIKAWLLFDYIEPLADPDGIVHTQSSVEYVEFDCKKPSFRSIANDLYADNMGSGSLIESFSPDFKWWLLKDGGQEKTSAHRSLCKYK